MSTRAHTRTGAGGARGRPPSGPADRPARPGRNALCPCGSGRKSKRCCDTAAPRAGARHAAGAPARALAQYRRGIDLRKAGNLAAARPCFEAAIAFGLADAAVFLDHARLLVLLGETDAAEAQYRRSLAARPDCGPACRELASLCLETDRADEACDWLRAAVGCDPDDIVARHNLAHALFRCGRPGDAIAALDAAIARAPATPELHVTQAALFEQENDLPRARRCAETALALDPGNGSAAVLLAKLAVRRGDAGTALALLDGVDAAPLSAAQQVTWLGERGRALELLGRHAEAFAAFRQAKAVLGRLQEFRPAHDLAARSARLAAVEAGLTAARWQRLALQAPEPLSGSHQGPQPVFVLGFMRAGTTLIERMLGAHPAIAPLGELPFIADAADALAAMPGGGFPQGPDHDDGRARAALAAQRRRYLDRVAHLSGASGNARFFVDKAPFNAEHLGLIRLLFPHAPIVHAIRHPLDVVLSGYFTRFESPQPWSASLADAARLYARLHDHLAIMAARFPAGFEPVRYERLVADPEAVMRALFDRIGVAWDAGCLDFHRRAAGVRTASYAQVSRPLYRSSVGRYRAYLPFIDPAAIAALRPAMDALGYDLAA